MLQHDAALLETQRRLAAGSLICAAAWSSFCGAAGAAVVLDQSYSFATANTSSSLSDGGTGFRTVQTFQVHHDGQLVQVDVDGNIFGALSMNILDTLHGVPESIVSTGVWTGSTGSFNQFSVAPITVTAGEELGFEVAGSGFHGELSGNDTGAFGPDAAYGGGAVYFVNPGAGIDSFRMIPGGDIYFRTYVSTTAVPEPSSWLAFSLGLVGLVLTARLQGLGDWKRRAARVRVGFPAHR